jgi:hypothetical protein
VYPIHNGSTGARGTDHPPFSNFLFTNLFSIKFLYFFIISSLFPYFNLFVSIFIQSYVNIKLHVSTLYYIDTNSIYTGKSDEIIKKQRNLIKNKFVNRKLEKGGWSVPRAPVILPIHFT